eukprot:7219963-Heterocapsa_arctica.AAC.1
MVFLPLPRLVRRVSGVHVGSACGWCGSFGELWEGNPLRYGGASLGVRGVFCSGPARVCVVVGGVSACGSIADRDPPVSVGVGLGGSVVIVLVGEGWCSLRDLEGGLL